MLAVRGAALRTSKVAFEKPDKVRLAYAYLGFKRWQEALAIFEELGEEPVGMDRNGPWGHFLRPFLPESAAAACREKLGLPLVQKPTRFDFGSPCVCMHEPSSFLVDGDVLWVGIAGNLYKLGLDLVTNAQFRLPVSADLPLTTLASGPGRIWIGTRGAGLLEFDEATNKCRLFSEEDGLLLSDVGALSHQNESLWIGFGHVGDGGTRLGGFGQLKLMTGRIESYVAPMPQNPLKKVILSPFDALDPVSGPPSHVVTSIANGPGGEVWIAVNRHGYRRYSLNTSSWDCPRTNFNGEIIAVGGGPKYLVLGLSLEQNVVTISSQRSTGSATNQVTLTNIVLTSKELQDLRTDTNYTGRIRGINSGHLENVGSLAVYDKQSGSWIGDFELLRLFRPPTSIEIANADFWLGGEGYISVVDLGTKTVRKTCFIPVRSVERIQVAGGYVWAQFDKHLYRVPLEKTR